MSTSTDFTVKILGDATNAKKIVDQFGDGLGKSASGWGAMFKNAAATAGGVLGALGIEDLASRVADFGAQSVDAFKEAQDSQALLEQAYAKFPALADTNIAKLRELNSALQAKTGYDDDQIAASQATLAQFGLTGDQISKLTPLMLDYAAKTGSDLTTSAEAMGKAVMGQGRALKTVGIDFTDTGSSAGNFDQIMSGLASTVGGTAETLGGTGAGQARILDATFGDLQETIGEKLLPVVTGFQSFLITDLIPAVSGVVDWISNNTTTVLALAGVVGGAAIAYGVWSTAIKLQTAYQLAASTATGGLTIAQWAWNAAISANPIGLIIIGIAALIAAIVLLVANWDTVVAWITEVWGGFIGWITDGLNAFGAWWSGFWAGIGQFVADAWNNWIVNPIRSAVDWISTAIRVGMQLVSSVWSATWNGLGGIVRGIWNGILGFIEDGINGVITMINGMIGAVNSVTGAVGIPTIGLIPDVSFPRLAAGTVTNGPLMALIGDNPGGREVVSPLDTYQDELRRAYTAGSDSVRVLQQTATGDQTVKLHPDSVQAIIGGLYDSIRLGSKRAITTALRG